MYMGRRLNRGQVKPYNSIPRIDWSHPLANGLQFYSYDAGGTIVDLVSGGLGAIFSNTAHATFASSKYGNGISLPGGQSPASDAIVIPSNSSVVNFGTTAPTTAIVGTIATVGFTNEGGALIADVNSNTPSAALIPTGVGNPNAIEWFWASGGAVSNTLHQVMDGTFQTWAAIATDATHGTTYSNGSPDQTGLTGTFTQTSFAGSAIAFGCSNNNGGQSGTSNRGGFNGFVPFYAGWNRAFSQQDAMSLHIDPWQFLIYPEEDFDIVGVTAGTLSAQIWL